MDFGNKASVFQAKNYQSLGFHGLGQPGAAMGLVQSQAKPKSWLAKVLVGAENIKFGPSCAWKHTTQI